MTELKSFQNNYRGRSEIFKGEQFLAKVDCDLIEQELSGPYPVEQIGDRNSSELQDTRKKVRGTIKITNGEKMLEGEKYPAPLTLHLEDGRSLEIYIENGGPGADGHWTYRVAQYSGNGFEPVPTKS